MNDAVRDVLLCLNQTSVKVLSPTTYKLTLVNNLPTDNITQNVRRGKDDDLAWLVVLRNELKLTCRLWQFLDMYR